MCPYCNTIICCDDSENNHTKECYKRGTSEGSLIKRSEEGSYMEFKSYKNMIKRPLVIYPDMECSLVKRFVKKYAKYKELVKTQVLHEHAPNSCCYNFVCSFDSSRNELNTFTGSNCVEEMIIDIYNLSLK